jgi:hypothetical protein
MSGGTGSCGLQDLVNKAMPKLVGRCPIENFPFQKIQDGQNICYFGKAAMLSLKEDQRTTCPYADLDTSIVAAGDYHCACRGKKK